MRRIIKAIPSFITSMNLLCGTLAVIFAIEGNIVIAIVLILIGAFFDFFDGFFARLLKASSSFGMQIDSLADLISFGFAPTALLYHFINSNSSIPYFAFVSVIIVIFSALRLAKFNIDTEQSIEFRGLPTPASALLIISIIAYCEFNPNSKLADILTTNEIVILVIIIVIATLMVSRLKLMSLKIKRLKFSLIIYQLILILSAIVLVIFFKYLGIGLTIILYIILSIIKNIINKNKKNEIHSTN